MITNISVPLYHTRNCDKTQRKITSFSFSIFFFFNIFFLFFIWRKKSKINKLINNTKNKTVHTRTVVRLKLQHKAREKCLRNVVKEREQTRWRGRGPKRHCEHRLNKRKKKSGKYLHLCNQDNHTEIRRKIITIIFLLIFMASIVFFAVVVFEITRNVSK